jgi:hypothetical protein
MLGRRFDQFFFDLCFSFHGEFNQRLFIRLWDKPADGAVVFGEVFVDDTSKVGGCDLFDQLGEIYVMPPAGDHLRFAQTAHDAQGAVLLIDELSVDEVLGLTQLGFADLNGFELFDLFIHDALGLGVGNARVKCDFDIEQAGIHEARGVGALVKRELRFDQYLKSRAVTPAERI